MIPIRTLPTTIVIVIEKFFEQMATIKSPRLTLIQRRNSWNLDGWQRRERRGHTGR